MIYPKIGRCWRNAFIKTRSILLFEIPAIVLLPDHFHLFLEMPQGDDDYSSRVRSIKTKFTIEFAKTNDTRHQNRSIKKPLESICRLYPYQSSGAQTRLKGNRLALVKLSPMGTNRTLLTVVAVMFGSDTVSELGMTMFKRRRCVGRTLPQLPSLRTTCCQRVASSCITILTQSPDSDRGLIIPQSLGFNTMATLWSGFRFIIREMNCQKIGVYL